MIFNWSENGKIYSPRNRYSGENGYLIVKNLRSEGITSLLTKQNRESLRE
jgi:hypothetical protein